MTTRSAPPGRIEDIEELEELMTRPGEALVDDLAQLEGDILVLGVGGKMGPTLARLAKRAAPEQTRHRRRPVQRAGPARASSRAAGIETIAADLLDREAVAALPRLANVIFMAGRKFGPRAARGADLGDERAGAGDGRGGVPRFADRRLLHGLRLSVLSTSQRRRDRGDAADRRRPATTPIPASAASACSSISRRALRHRRAG